MLSDCRHPRFRNLNSTVPVDVARLKSYVDSLLKSTRVPVMVSVNKLNFVSERITLVLLACSESAEVWVCESRVFLSSSLISSCMHLPISPMYTLPHSQEIFYTPPSCFRGSTESLGRTNCDLSVVSDLKAGRTPCCCRQRRRSSDKSLMYGRTAVDLTLVAGSLSDACRILDFVVLVTNE